MMKPGPENSDVNLAVLRSILVGPDEELKLTFLRTHKRKTLERALSALEQALGTAAEQGGDMECCRLIAHQLRNWDATDKMRANLAELKNTNKPEFNSGGGASKVEN